MLSPTPPLFNECANILSKEFGPIDYQSDILAWGKTDYYRDEMGDDIVRKFIFFERLIDPGELPKIKLFTNTIEKDFGMSTADRFRRRINLDPGYMTEAKVVLATTKDFSHRVYIGANIYAEVTLRYSVRDNNFAPYDYTYPDYRTDLYRTMFNNARDLLRATLRPASQK